MRSGRCLLLIGVVVVSSCSATGAQPKSAPAGAAIVVDQDGAHLGWLTSRADSGGDWVGLVRRDLAGPTATDLDLDRGGLTVRTTIGGSEQAALRAALDAVPSTNGRFEVAAVAIDVASGGVVAVADSSAQAELSSIRRPTGSAFKFVIAAAAVDAGAISNDVLDGGHRCGIPDGRSTVAFSGKPQYSLAPLSTLTAFSVNCAFAKLYEIIGGQTVLHLASALGLTGAVVDSPTLATGAAQETPIEMAGAMRVVLGDGRYTPPFIIDTVTAADGRVLFQHRADNVDVLSADVSHRTADLLTNVVRVGTARDAALAADRPSAGKTGTQEGNTDAWMVGGTPQFSVAVWMGDPARANDGMVDVAEFDKVTLVQGGTLPAQVWKRFLDAALVGVPPLSWPEPAQSRAPLHLILPAIECSDDALVSSIGLSAVPETAAVSDC